VKPDRIEHSSAQTGMALQRIEELYAAAADALDEMEAELSAAKEQRELWSTHEKKLLAQRDAANSALGSMRLAINKMQEAGS